MDDAMEQRLGEIEARLARLEAIMSEPPTLEEQHQLKAAERATRRPREG